MMVMVMVVVMMVHLIPSGIKERARHPIAGRRLASR